MADTRTDPQYKLRLPIDLKMRIEAAAQSNNRSMNAEIVSALEDRYPAPENIEFLFSYMKELAERIKTDKSAEVFHEFVEVTDRVNEILTLEKIRINRKMRELDE